MSFPLGKPILVIFILSLLSGVAIELLPRAPKTDQTVWVFADAHARMYAQLAEDYQAISKQAVSIDNVGDSVNLRLLSLFMTRSQGPRLPDAVEIEIGNIGKFFRAPGDEIGFLPLNHYLESTGFRTIQTTADPGQTGWNARCDADGRIYTFADRRWQLNLQRDRPDAWIDRIAPARFSPWSVHGKIYGLPHDVHPVTLTYRDDLFRDAGIDLSAARTWPEFQEKCLAFQDYCRKKGFAFRHAIELSDASSDNLVNMLLQRHVNLVDGQNQIHLDDPAVLSTLCFYVNLVAGPRAIGTNTDSNTGLWIRDFERGDVCCVWTPDWRVDLLKQYAGRELSGKLRMMPLPRFDPGDSQTSTWGGTMIGIPRNSTNPDAAWKLLEFLYFSPAAIETARRDSNIITPLMERWNDPFYREPDDFFGGQTVRQLYVELAREVPPRNVTPSSTIAQISLSVVLNRAVQYVRLHGNAGLEEACRQWLAEAKDDLRLRIAHGSFEAGGQSP